MQWKRKSKFFKDVKIANEQKGRREEKGNAVFKRNRIAQRKRQKMFSPKGENRRSFRQMTFFEKRGRGSGMPSLGQAASSLWPRTNKGKRERQPFTTGASPKIPASSWPAMRRRQSFKRACSSGVNPDITSLLTSSTTWRTGSSKFRPFSVSIT